MAVFREFLKKILPLSIRIFDNRLSEERKQINRSVEGLKEKIDSSSSMILKSDEVIIEKFGCFQKEMTTKIIDIERKLNDNESKLESIINILNELQRETSVVLCNKEQEIIDNLEKNSLELINIRKTVGEVVWAEVFNNTITKSEWLINQQFSPGRWAAGYPMLYSLYRILDEFRPKSLLELGLGQTTKMITQYAKLNDIKQHFAIEHDPKWIDFFVNNTKVAEKTEVIQCDLGLSEFNEDSEVVIYEGFADKLKGKKFDFIVIDAPFGGKAKKYARIDILQLLPEILSETFVVVWDDTNRIGEQNSIKEFVKILEYNNIAYSSGVYTGEKQTKIFVSEDLKFLCTM